MIKEMSTRSNYSQDNNNIIQDTIEIEMVDINDMNNESSTNEMNDTIDINDNQIMEHLVPISTTNNTDHRMNYRLIGRFVCNVMFISITMLLFTGVGAIIGFIVSEIRHKHDIF